MTWLRSSGAPPTLIVWITAVSFVVIVSVLGLVFLVLTWQTRARLARAAAEDLEVGQRWFSDREAQRVRERRLQAVALAESPTLKAAVDTYLSEIAAGTPSTELLPTIRSEVTKLANLMGVSALAVVDPKGQILASAGPRDSDWLVGTRVTRPRGAESVADAWDSDEFVIARGQTMYLATAVPLVLGGDSVATVLLTTPLDDAYAAALAEGARASVLVLSNGRVVAGAAPDRVRAAVDSTALPAVGTVRFNGDDLVVRRLSGVGDAQVFALSSVASAATSTTSEVTRVLLAVSALALLLAGAASWWLARTLAQPIDALRAGVARMVDDRDLQQPIARSGVSREIDALADQFDALRAAVSQAEAESDAAYLGVIGALAAALDARHPYTAGHSERVSTLSVLLATELGLSEDDRETLRLGALLHDIGKIGISDNVLRKADRLTPDEVEHIKLHPVLGARILQPLAFLERHIPVVELHHERPDGRGYPHRLKGDEIPLFARIVHVADAFDAMTSARAYRPARPAEQAMAELWMNVGTDFDERVVQAMAAVWHAARVRTDDGPGDEHRGRLQASAGRGVTPFRMRAVRPLPPTGTDPGA